MGSLDARTIHRFSIKEVFRESRIPTEFSGAHDRQYSSAENMLESLVRFTVLPSHHLRTGKGVPGKAIPCVQRIAR